MSIHLPDHASGTPAASPAAPAAGAAGVLPDAVAALIGSGMELGAAPHATHDELLTSISALEALKSWADYASLAVTAVLAGRLIEEYDHDAAAWRSGGVTVNDDPYHQAVAVIADEIQLATGIGYDDAHTRVEFATTGSPLCTRHLRTLLREGTCTWWRAKTVFTECRGLPPTVADQIAGTVFAATRSGAALTNGTFRARLRRELHKARKPEARDADAIAKRHARASYEADGTGTFTITGATEQVTAAYDRVDRAARALKALGDPRSLAQLRSDIALNVLTYGDLPTTTSACTNACTCANAPAGTNAGHAAAEGGCGSGATAGGCGSGASAGGFGSGATAGGCGSGASARGFGRSAADDGVRSPTAPGHHGSAADDLTAHATSTHTPNAAAPGAPAAPAAPDGGAASAVALWRLGALRLPPARVDVVVSLATLLGLSDTPGTMNGVGDVPAGLIREMAHTAGSTWRRLVVDDLGALCDLSSRSYTPAPRLRAAVLARDVVCRAPECQVPASSCDLDHERDYAHGGATDLANLSAKHRRHHQHKTSRLWTTTTDPDGQITWRTWAGRTYTTTPYDYRHYLAHTPPDMDYSPRIDLPDDFDFPPDITDFIGIPGYPDLFYDLPAESDLPDYVDAPDLCDLPGYPDLIDDDWPDVWTPAQPRPVIIAEALAEPLAETIAADTPKTTPPNTGTSTGAGTGNSTSAGIRNSGPPPF